MKRRAFLASVAAIPAALRMKAPAAMAIGPVISYQGAGTITNAYALWVQAGKAEMSHSIPVLITGDVLYMRLA